MTNAMILTADKEMVAFIQQAVEGLPLKIVLAASRIKPVMEAYANAPAQLFFVDYFLPESSGIEAMKPLKRMDESMMVILLTRVKGRGQIEKAFRHGATDVLYYPLERDVLRQTVLHRLEQLARESMMVFQQQE